MISLLELSVVRAKVAPCFHFISANVITVKIINANILHKENFKDYATMELS